MILIYPAVVIDLHIFATYNETKIRYFSTNYSATVGGLLGDDISCGCSLSFPFNLKFSCQYTESYCIGPRVIADICGKPKFSGNYGLGVSPTTEVCFIGDDDNDASFKGDFCLKGYHSPTFIQFQDCDASYNGQSCAICEACGQTGFLFRFDCNAVGGPVLACVGLGAPPN
jgi:hypothetical protein